MHLWLLWLSLVEFYTFKANVFCGYLLHCKYDNNILFVQSPEGSHEGRGSGQRVASTWRQKCQFGLALLRQTHQEPSEPHCWTSPQAADGTVVTNLPPFFVTVNGSCHCHCHLLNHFQIVTPEKYEVKGSIQEAAIILTSCTEPKMQVTITLTSPIIREETGRDGGWESPHSLFLHCTFFLVPLLSPLWNQFHYVGWHIEGHCPAGTPLWLLGWALNASLPPPGSLHFVNDSFWFFWNFKWWAKWGSAIHHCCWHQFLSIKA